MKENTALKQENDALDKRASVKEILETYGEILPMEKKSSFWNATSCPNYSVIWCVILTITGSTHLQKTRTNKID